jgi:hypothetical protein
MLKRSTAWWRWAKFYHRRSVDHWILAGGIDHWSNAYSSGFIVRILVRVNPDDRVVVDEVPIGGRIGPSIGFIVASCLTTAWNVAAEFLRLWGNSMSIVVMRRASCSWARCSRSSLCITLLIIEPCAQDRRHASLWMMIFRTGTACPSGISHRRSMIPWVHKDESQRFSPSWRVSVDVWSLDT